MWEKIKLGLSYIWGRLFGFDSSVDRDYTGVFPLKHSKPKKTVQKVKIAADADNKVKNNLKGGFRLKKNKVTIIVPYLWQGNLEPGPVRKVGCLFACISMVLNYYGKKKFSKKEFNDFLIKCKKKKYVTGNAYVQNLVKIPSLEELSLTYNSLSISDKIKASQSIIDLLEKDIPVIIKLQHPSAKNEDGSVQTHYEVIFGYYYNKQYDEVVFLVHDPGFQKDKFLNPYILQTFMDKNQVYSTFYNKEAGEFYNKGFKRYGMSLTYYQKKEKK